MWQISQVCKLEAAILIKKNLFTCIYKGFAQLLWFFGNSYFPDKFQWWKLESKNYIQQKLESSLRINFQDIPNNISGYVERAIIQ